ncbi:MAG: rod shape-determining protein RodA [Bacteroidetes bacterium]|nr:MAG: rod shape-determining protein RodA [Bacteroidota bacterium]
MNRKRLDFDALTILLYFGLVLLGWMTIYAVTSVNGDVWYDFSTIHGKQLIWIGLGTLIGGIILSLDHRFLEALSYVFYAAAIALLVLVLVAGKEVNGAKSWLIIAGQPFQPSEFAKLATAMALAKYMSRMGFSMYDWKQFVVAAGIVLTPASIVILQNDTGSALVFGAFLIVFFREGLNPLVPLLLIFTGAVAIVTLWCGEPLYVSGGLAALGLISYRIVYERRSWLRLAVIHALAVLLFAGLSFSVDFIVGKLKPHQQIRIEVLFDPGKDPQGAGYNVIQSKIAIGSGGLTGKGYLQGKYTKYKFVPKQETDFIYCTIGEEWGWLGASFVLLLFLGLLGRVQFLAENAKTRYARIYGYSVLSIVFFHVLVNVGMTIGLVPVIGIPLPFFSYGGSSLLAFTVLIFILVNLYSYRASVLGSKV